MLGFGAFPLWAGARSGRYSALFHVEHFPIRPQFPKCSTWNKTPTIHPIQTLRPEPHPPFRQKSSPYKPTDHPPARASIAQPCPLTASTSSSNQLPHPRLHHRLRPRHLPNTTTTPTADSQPAPAKEITAASLIVSATAEDSIGPAFTGLLYKKLRQRILLVSPQPPRPTSSPFSSGSSPVSCASGETPPTKSSRPLPAGETPEGKFPSQRDRPGRLSEGRHLTVSQGDHCGRLRNWRPPASADAEVASDFKNLRPWFLEIETPINAPPRLPRKELRRRLVAVPIPHPFAPIPRPYPRDRSGRSLHRPTDASCESTGTVPSGEATTKSEITLLSQHEERARDSLPTPTKHI